MPKERWHSARCRGSIVRIEACGARPCHLATLLFAILPRLINLCHVWLPSRYPVARLEKLDFWLNLLGIIAAIFNAFVHSRDAYAMVPLNVILSVITVASPSIGQIVLAVGKSGFREAARE
ncbi:hypothetical protein B0G69_7329 [Paraburkholderia sp. RAU2J]|uniref:hypothetical protein n=1 Tax=Paraburkholderia sp. RAU2J TaxID=1938810 RepID=UPI000EAE5383|nr:hypothetical protein B0G69_7329 [Paraburkholderia sp. RAU2J]